MSESSISTSTKTKSTVSHTTDASDDIINHQERWTNNINYRQLVMSSCIGILQFWWHPYLHDLTKLIPFLLVYNFCSFLIGYPMFYLELAIGVVTKNSLLGCWNIAPSMRGLGVTMLVCCALTALSTSIVAAYCLSLCVNTFHTFLPWLHCAGGAAGAGGVACAARHRPAMPNADSPAQAFLLNFVLGTHRDSTDGLGGMVWDLTAIYVVCWFLIYLIALKRIYSYSKLVFFKDSLACFTLFCVGVGVGHLDGASKMFAMADWNTLASFELWRVALEYSLLEMSVGTGTLIMLGSYCPKDDHKLGVTALFSYAMSKITSTGTALALGAVHGALLKDYDDVANIMQGGSASLVMWSDLVARIPGSQFWSLLVFFTLFVLALSTSALLVTSLVSAISTVRWRSFATVAPALVCVILCYVGVVTLCTKDGIFVLNSLMSWPVSRLPLLAASLTAIVVTMSLGQRAFCESVFYAAAEYPCVFLRLTWATTPYLILLVFILGVSLDSPDNNMNIAGRILVIVSVLPTFIVQLFYILFKCRVRNIVTLK